MLSISKLIWMWAAVIVFDALQSNDRAELELAAAIRMTG